MEDDLVVVNKRDFDLVGAEIGTLVEVVEEEEGRRLRGLDFLF